MTRAASDPGQAASPTNAELTGDELMTRVRDLDDVVAFELLRERYKDRCYRIAARCLRSPEDAAEATQDAFLKLWRARRRYDGSAFEPWFYRIGVNAALDLYRKRRREKLTVPLQEGQLHRTYSHNQAELARIHVEAIRRWRAGLNKTEKIAVQYTDGLASNQELAVQAGVSEARLSQVRKDALNRLRKLLA